MKNNDDVKKASVLIEAKMSYLQNGLHFEPSRARSITVLIMRIYKTSDCSKYFIFHQRVSDNTLNTFSFNLHNYSKDILGQTLLSNSK